MNCGNLTHLISLVFFCICSVYGYEKVYEDKVPRQEKMDEELTQIRAKVEAMEDLLKLMYQKLDTLL